MHFPFCEHFDLKFFACGDVLKSIDIWGNRNNCLQEHRRHLYSGVYSLHELPAFLVQPEPVGHYIIDTMPKQQANYSFGTFVNSPLLSPHHSIEQQAPQEEQLLAGKPFKHLPSLSNFLNRIGRRTGASAASFVFFLHNEDIFLPQRIPNQTHNVYNYLKHLDHGSIYLRTPPSD